MKKTLIAAAFVTLALGAGSAASASPYRHGYSFEAREAQIAERIHDGLRYGDLTRREAGYLRSELREIRALEHRYGYDGFSRWERHDLDRRLDRLSARVRFNRHDRQDHWNRDGGFDHYGPR